MWEQDERPLPSSSTLQANYNNYNKCTLIVCLIFVNYVLIQSDNLKLSYLIVRYYSYNSFRLCLQHVTFKVNKSTSDYCFYKQCIFSGFLVFQYKKTLPPNANTHIRIFQIKLVQVTTKKDFSSFLELDNEPSLVIVCFTTFYTIS